MTKRIAIISDCASPLAALDGVACSGENAYVASLALELAERGHLVDVFTRRTAVRAPEIVGWARGVRIVHVNAGPATSIPKEKLLPYMPMFGDYIVDFARRLRIRYDVAHANFWTSAVAAHLVKRTLDIPFVVTFHALGRVKRLHESAADQLPVERCEIEEALVAEADAIVAECPQNAEELVALYRARRERVRVVPHGVDTRRFHDVGRERARRVLKLEADRPTLLQLGRLVPRKGVDDVIRSLAALRDLYSIRARLLIVGGETDLPDERATPYLRELREVARLNGVDDSVTFVGRRGGDVLRYFYSAADIFITTPWYEPFGITPLEAMSCGVPVIGSNVGGIKYTVADGETGFLVPPRDPQAIASRAAALLNDRRLHERMSATATLRVRSHFAWRDIAASIDELYSDVIRRRSVATRTLRFRSASRVT